MAANGILALNAQGQWIYTPAPNANGADSFTYRVSDGQLDSATVTASVTITPVNDAPVLAPPNFTVVEDVAQPLNLLALATDVDGDSLTIQIVTQPTKGTLVRDAQGQ